MKRIISIFLLLLGFAFTSTSFAAPPERQRTEFKFQEQQFIYFNVAAVEKVVTVQVHQNDKEVFTLTKARILDEILTVLKMSVSCEAKSNSYSTQTVNASTYNRVFY